MEYLIIKIKLFLILHKRKIDMLILILLYLLCIEPNLLDITSCSPTPVDPGLPACLDAYKLAIEDLQKTSASKSCLSGKAQTVTTNGMPSGKGIETVMRDGHSYTVQVVNVTDGKRTFRIISDCVTAVDVLHSWTIPSFGVKVDACSGRLNQANLFIKRFGVFFGQCSEICGVNHGFMPIVLLAIPSVQYHYCIMNNLQLQ